MHVLNRPDRYFIKPPRIDRLLAPQFRRRPLIHLREHRPVAILEFRPHFPAHLSRSSPSEASTSATPPACPGAPWPLPSTRQRSSASPWPSARAGAGGSGGGSISRRPTRRCPYQP